MKQNKELANLKSFEVIQSEKQKEERMKKREQSLRDLRNTNKKSNICIMRLTEGEERDKGEETYFTKNDKNFPSMGEEKDIQIQEASYILNKMKPYLEKSAVSYI